MKSNKLSLLVSLGVIFGWCLSQSIPVNPAFAEALTPEQETALKSIVQDLENLKANPDQMKKVR
ncbi:MAG: hypothetical protein KC978_24520 [Candidatus Omnitrophica bacterium]|nr:hypothetical protein [Candidatus Omnitrophota bacterium]